MNHFEQHLQSFNDEMGFCWWSQTFILCLTVHCVALYVLRTVSRAPAMGSRASASCCDIGHLASQRNLLVLQSLYCVHV